MSNKFEGFIHETTGSSSRITEVVETHQAKFGGRNQVEMTGVVSWIIKCDPNIGVFRQRSWRELWIDHWELGIGWGAARRSDRGSCGGLNQNLGNFVCLFFKVLSVIFFRLLYQLLRFTCPPLVIQLFNRWINTEGVENRGKVVVIATFFWNGDAGCSSGGDILVA
jgi:hypothetical protein